MPTWSSNCRRICPRRTRIPSRLKAWVADLAQKVDPFVERNLRWNFSVNLLDISFITLAFSLISRETITPLLISNLTDSKIAIGLAPAIYSIAYYLPQLFAANHAERLRRKLPFVRLVGGLLERVPYSLRRFGYPALCRGLRPSSPCSASIWSSAWARWAMASPHRPGSA